MLNKIQKNKYIIGGGIGLAALGGGYIYYKRKQEKERLFTKAFKLITMHQTEVLLSYMDSYIPLAIKSLSLGNDMTLDSANNCFKNQNTIFLILQILSNFAPDYLQKLAQKQVIVCQKLGIDINEYGNWDQKNLRNKKNRGELNELIQQKLRVFNALYSGNYPFLPEDIEFPEFLTGEFRVEFERRNAELNMKTEFQLIYEYYEENKGVVERGEKLKINQDFAKKLVSFSEGYIEKRMKILTSKKYFGKDWEEKYDFHPILIYHNSGRNLSKDVNGIEALLKMRECGIIIREKMIELSNDINLEVIKKIKEECEELIKANYDEAMESMKKIGK